MSKLTTPYALAFLLGVPTLFCLTGCGDSPTGTSDMVDSGSWYRTGFRWPHDGAPYESEHFIVFSDGASVEARREVADIAEDLLVALTEEFEITPATHFRFPVGQSKIHIMAYKDHTPMEWGGWGYYGGLLIFSLDHELRTEWGHTELNNYTRVVKHELMHVIEGLIKGADNPQLVDVWLTEGIAEYVAGGTQSIASVKTLAQLEELVANFGELNPVAMHQYNYPDIPNVGAYYYVMFELATWYLLDPDGAGQQKPSIRDIYLDARDGVPFASAFQNRLGMDLQGFEDDFFDLVRGFVH